MVTALSFGAKAGTEPAGLSGALGGNIRVIWGLYRGYIGVMEKKMETLGPFKGII